MKVVSYHKKAARGDHFTFWEDGIGRALPMKIAELLGTQAELFVISGEGYATLPDSYIAFCALYEKPAVRPPGFVYTFVSDIVGYEDRIKDWIEEVSPNLLVCLQTMRPDIIEFCAKKDCSVRLFPWFVTALPEERDKTITAMCTGCTDPAIYPSRKLIAEYLTTLGRTDVIVSCSQDFGKYKLSNEEYLRAIANCRYYLSGAIYDRYIPPKYYEAAANGCCLLTFPVPGMETLGFYDGQTCIVLKDLSDIPRIIESDAYGRIGRAARKMVLNMHTTEIRALQILSVFREAGL